MSKIENQELEATAMPEENEFSQLLRLLEESDEDTLQEDDCGDGMRMEMQLDDGGMAVQDEAACSDVPDGEPQAAVVVLENAAEDHASEYQIQENLSADEDYTNLELPEGMLPGAIEMIVVDEEPEEVRPRTWQDDGDHSDFMNYLLGRMKAIPEHSGQTTVGCEKAISYLKKLDKEISKAIQSDDENVIDESQAEKIRDTIHDYIEKLEDAYNTLVDKKRKRKKKAGWSLGKQIVARLGSEDIEYYASVQAGNEEERLVKVEVVEPTDKQVQAFIEPEQQGLTKEASHLVTYIDPFIDSITRLLIRSQITQGKDIREVYAQLNEQYSFTDREKLSIHEVLKQKGIGGTGIYVDLGRVNDDNFSPFDGKNIEFVTEYYS